MDSGLFNIIYFDRRATADRFVDRGHSKKNPSTSGEEQNGIEQDPGSIPDVRSNIQALLAVFRQVHVCRSSSSCLTTISQLNPSNTQTVPTILLVAVMSHDDESASSPSSGGATAVSPRDRLDPDKMFGMPFLHHISFEIQQQKISSMVVPVAVLCKEQTIEKQNHSAQAKWDSSSATSDVWKGPARILRYLDAGAADVLLSPVSEDRVRALPSHAYRAYKESTRNAPLFVARQGRKTSWVGVNEARPYAYLREAMVSGLMDGICNPDHLDQAIDPREVHVPPDRQETVAAAVGTWAFSAHDFSDDELLHGALCILQHALSVPELEKWRIDAEHLTVFLIACRRVYNSFVLYHNFRHACDVLQATFFFLLRIGALPPYRNDERRDAHKSSPIASLVGPFHTLTLLISAIGHDVGHPGVNNLFLVTLNAPLAQLYNDKSVLESFHCAAYSQILRRYWPAAFKDTTMRKLMINTILATDMALHAQYMNQMGNLHEKLNYNGNSLDGWSEKVLEEYRELTCCLLIKCADICNVARKFETAEEWSRILTDEFHNQGLMEQELTMPSCLFGGPPVLNDVLKMGNSQISFMNIFAGPLFEGVTNLLPPMHVCVDEVAANKAIWQDRIDHEREKRATKAGSVTRTDGTASPRSGSTVDLRGQRPSQTSDSTAIATTSSRTVSSPTSSDATATQPPNTTTPPAGPSANDSSTAPSEAFFSPDYSQSNPTSSISQSQSGLQSSPTASTSLASMASQSQGQPQSQASQPQSPPFNLNASLPQTPLKYPPQPISIPPQEHRSLSMIPLPPPADPTNNTIGPAPMSRVRTMDASLASSSSLGSLTGGSSDRDQSGSRFGLRYWRTRLKSIGSSPSKSPGTSP